LFQTLFGRKFNENVLQIRMEQEPFYERVKQNKYFLKFTFQESREVRLASILTTPRHKPTTDLLG